jgi:hypothetical protein
VDFQPLFVPVVVVAAFGLLKWASLILVMWRVLDKTGSTEGFRDVAEVVRATREAVGPRKRQQ